MKEKKRKEKEKGECIKSNQEDILHSRQSWVDCVNRIRLSFLLLFFSLPLCFLRPNSWTYWDKILQSFPPCYLQSPLLTVLLPSSWAKVVWTGLLCKQCIRKPQVWELSILCPETSIKLYGWRNSIRDWTIAGKGGPLGRSPNSSRHYTEIRIMPIGILCRSWTI